MLLRLCILCFYFDIANMARRCDKCKPLMLNLKSAVKIYQMVSMNARRNLIGFAMSSKLSLVPPEPTMVTVP